MTTASGARLLRRGWVRQRPWLGGVAAGAAALAAWAAIASIDSRTAASAREAAEAAVGPLEVPPGFLRPNAADRAFYSESAAQVDQPESGKTILRWTFDGGFPSRWRTAPAEDTPQPRIYRTTTGLAVETTTAPLGYQLVSAPRVLKPGRYLLVTRAGVVRGGMQIGVLAPETNAWLSTRLFWSGQPGLEGKPLVAQFSLSYATRLQVVLANWKRVAGRSLWEIRDVSVVRRAAPRALTPPERDYLEERAAATPQPTLPRYESWGFTRRLPRDWTLSAEALPSFDAGAMTVETGSGRSDYQLLSPELDLPSGRYEIVLRGAVADGGVLIGALDTERDEWVATRTFWQAQKPRQGYVVPFELGASTPTSIVLANWSARARPSTWEITAIELRRRSH